MANQPMGIGKLGGRNLVLKRKFRWTFELQDICGGKTVPPSFVKLAARPNLTIEETEINYLNAKTWVPGKASWETITVTYYDAAEEDNMPLWDWLASVYDFTQPFTLTQASQRRDYACNAILKMYDGGGTALEEWRLGDMWPQAINFGELDYSTSEESNIELTLRYAEVKYRSLCPNRQPNPCYTPCSGNTVGGIAANAAGTFGNANFFNG